MCQNCYISDHYRRSAILPNICRYTGMSVDETESIYRLPRPRPYGNRWALITMTEGGGESSANSSCLLLDHPDWLRLSFLPDLPDHAGLRIEHVGTVRGEGTTSSDGPRWICPSGYLVALDRRRWLLGKPLGDSSWSGVATQQSECGNHSDAQSDPEADE
jgi:hypothetical protein